MSDSLRHEHLLAACDWAEGAGAAHPHLDNYKYDQETWDCGTACCLHGAAHLIATGEPAEYGPSEDDYRDLLSQIRAGVLMVLQDYKGTPELLRLVLKGEVVVPNPDCDPDFFDDFFEAISRMKPLRVDLGMMNDTPQRKFS